MTKHGGDETIKGVKTEDELETTNSDEAESVWMFDSNTLNQPTTKWMRR